VSAERTGNTDLESLARRAVACPRWRWMPGMRATWPDDSRPGRRFERGWVSDYSGKEKFGCTDEHALPDLSDPATIGCLLALVREAWGKPVWVRTGAVWIRTGDYGNEVCWRDGPHSISILFPDRDADADSEVSALVAALEAAP